MSAKKSQSKINLLPQKGFEVTTAGRVLSWILSTFRIIVILTELIVMIAFLSRFWLDAQNTDLTEEIQQKHSVLAASLDFEKDFKDVQKRLEIYSDLNKNEKKISYSLNFIDSYLPTDLFLTSAIYSEGMWQIEGVSASEKSVQQYIVNLQSLKIGEVDVSKLQSDTKDPNILEFNIGIKMENF